MLHTRIAIILCVFPVIFRSAVAAHGDNCCSLNITEIKGVTTLDPFRCVTRVDPFLKSKCDVCRKGTCRIDMQCYCADVFFPTSKCNYSFGASWPQSIGREDTTWRSCLKQPPTTSTEHNCCTLSEEKLEAGVGTSNLCPTRNTSVTPVVTLDQKCDLCPFGTCRVGMNCYCPKDFLESVAYHQLCRLSFTKKWNESVPLEDKHWRSCVQRTPSQPNTFDNCCAISNEQLDIRIGTNNACPLFQTGISSYVKTLDNECDPCPFGTCRVASSCFCPADFLDSSEQKARCQESFGDVYPDSVGKKDTSCPTNPTPAILSASPSTTPTVLETPSVTRSPIPSATPEVLETSGEIPSPIPSSSTEAAVQGNKETTSSDSLTKVGTVVGIVVGILSAIALMVGWITCLWKWRRRKKSEQTENGSSPGEGLVFETSACHRDADNESDEWRISV